MNKLIFMFYALLCRKIYPHGIKKRRSTLDFNFTVNVLQFEHFTFISLPKFMNCKLIFKHQFLHESSHFATLNFHFIFFNTANVYFNRNALSNNWTLQGVFSESSRGTVGKFMARGCDPASIGLRLMVIFGTLDKKDRAASMNSAARRSPRLFLLERSFILSLKKKKIRILSRSDI